MHDRRAPRDRPARDASAFVPVTVAGRGTNVLPAIVLATGLAFVLAFVKPWGDGVAGPTPLVQAPATPTPVGGPTVVPDESAAEIGRMCLDTSAWLVARGADLRSAGPHLAGDRAGGRRPPRRSGHPVGAHHLGIAERAGLVRAGVRRRSALGSDLGGGMGTGPPGSAPWPCCDCGRPVGDSSLGGLYRPALAPAAISPTAAWPAGRYLFRVLSGDGREVTFGVNVEVVPAARVPAVP